MHQITTPRLVLHSPAHRQPRRRRAAAGLASLLVAASTMALASSGHAHAATSSDTAMCQAADGTYQLGCRTVPGLPDGWFVPGGAAISTSVVPGNVR